MGPIWATCIWDNQYGTHVEPDCTPHMGGPYGTHICMFAGYGANVEPSCTPHMGAHIGPIWVPYGSHIDC